MHRCSYNSQGNMMGQCACGLFHSHQANSFSMLFAMQPPTYHSDNSSCPFISSSPSSAVDCTLSLGTPSTRLSNDIYGNNNNNNNNNVSVKGVPMQHHDQQRRSNSYMPNFCWDILQPKHTTAPPTSNNNNNKSSRGGSHMTTNISGGDPLIARRCANCDTTSTPLWRNGPRGPKSLCNACGIRFKKEERRATATAATNNGSGGGAAGGGIMESHYSNINNNAWVHHHQYSQQAAQKMPCFGSNEFRFMNDVVEDRDSESSIPFLSWRLNVTDRPSLVHDFTR